MRQRLRGEDVVPVREGIAAQCGVPVPSKADNGSEFAGCVMDRWTYGNGVEIDFSRPGNPRQCLDRALHQWAVMRGMPERPLILVARRCEAQDRGVTVLLTRYVPIPPWGG